MLLTTDLYIAINDFATNEDLWKIISSIDINECIFIKKDYTEDDNFPNLYLISIFQHLNESLSIPNSIKLKHLILHSNVTIERWSQFHVTELYKTLEI